MKETFLKKLQPIRASGSHADTRYSTALTGTGSVQALNQGEMTSNSQHEKESKSRAVDISNDGVTDPIEKPSARHDDIDKNPEIVNE